MQVQTETEPGKRGAQAVPPVQDRGDRQSERENRSDDGRKNRTRTGPSGPQEQEALSETYQTEQGKEEQEGTGHRTLMVLQPGR